MPAGKGFIGGGHVLKMKRVLDIAGAAAALLLLSPILAVVALAVRLCIGRPVLFRQTRPGHLEKPFVILKFRTMRDVLDAQGLPLPDAIRLHPLGTVLRRMSLDELPEFWNVLRGDMSLVGPRPLLMEYLPRYTVEQRQRHLVKPGITGLAQIRGRQDITFSRRIELDNWYVHHHSLWLDLSILIKTVAYVIAGSGVRSGQDVSKVDDLNTAANSCHASIPFDHTAS